MNIVRIVLHGIPVRFIDAFGFWILGGLSPGIHRILSFPVTESLEVWPKFNLTMNFWENTLAALAMVPLNLFDAKPPRLPIVAHRGLLLHAPENTLANFQACLELRLGFEFDVERTKDGHLVCIHDNTDDRTTYGAGKVSEMTLNKIRHLDAGSWFDARYADEKVPTVKEVLKTVAEYQQRDVLIAVDLKAENVEQEMVRLAEKNKVLGIRQFRF